MILIGMLHHRKDPNSVPKAYAYASAAKLEGAELIYFTPNSIDFEKRIIKGYKYIGGTWQKVEERFPDVIYRTGLSAKFSNAKSIIKKLKRNIPFISQSIGDKMTIFNILREDEEIREHLIPSKLVYTFKELYDYLHKYGRVVLKTNRGHRGIGIVYIEKMGEMYKIMTRQSNLLLPYYEFKTIMTEKINEQSHHVQPYIHCKTKSNHSYILRSHIQKNGQNKWVLVSVFPEIALSDSIIANTNCGGATNQINQFLAEEFGSDVETILSEIESLSIKIGIHLERYTKLHKTSSISELGIDVGFDERGKIWVFEVNDLPGCPPTFNLEMDLVRNHIQYAIFLAKMKKESEENS